MTKCINCGYNAKESDNYCKKCGTKLLSRVELLDEKHANAKFDYSKPYEKIYDNVDEEILNELEAEKPVEGKAETSKKLPNFLNSFKDLVGKKKEVKEEIPEQAENTEKDLEPAFSDLGNNADKEDLGLEEVTKAREEIETESLQEENGYDLEVPAFLKQKMDRDQENLKSEKFNDIISDSHERKERDNKGKRHERPKMGREKENFENTVLLPNLDEYLNQNPLENRQVLSSEKKQLIKESLEKADPINHEIQEINHEASQDPLSYTQEIPTLDPYLAVDERRVIESSHGAREESEKAREENHQIDPEIAEEPRKERNKKKSSKRGEKKKLNLSKILIPALTILSLFSIAMVIGSSLTNKNRVIASFEEAVKAGNQATVGNILEASDKDVLSGEKEVGPFIDLMQKDELYSSAFISAIKEDSSKLSADKAYKSTRSYRLEKMGKKFIFFDNYKVVVDPNVLDVKAQADEEYTINETAYKGSSKINLLPGIYKIAKAGSEDREVKLSISNKDLANNSLSLDLSSASANTGENVAKAQEEAPAKNPEAEKLQGNIEFYIDSSQTKALVYINGQNTSMTVEEYNAIPMKSIKQGDKLKIGQKYPWGMCFSKEHEYNGEPVLSFFVDMKNEESREAVMNRVVQALKDDGAARRNMSLDLFTALVEPETSASKQIIQDGIDQGLVYNRYYDSISFDPASFELYVDENNQYNAFICGEISYRNAEFYQGENPDDYPLNETKSVQGFHLVYVEDQANWFINTWGFTDKWTYINDPITKTIEE